MMAHLSPHVYPPPRRNVRGDILFTFAIAICLYLAWLLRDVLVLLYVSALFAVVLMPVVRGVQRIQIRKWHPSHGIAILIIMVLVIGAIACFLILTLPPLVHEVTTFVKAFPGRSPAFLDKLKGLPLVRDLDLTAVEIKLKQATAQHAGAFVASVSDWAAKLFAIITGIILTIYFLAEGQHVYHWALSLIPADRRPRLDETLQRAAARMGRWLLGQLALMLILGVCSGIVFGAMHLRYAFALAVLMGCFNIVPVVGAFVSTGIVMLFAASDSWEKVLGVVIFELIYVQIENAYLTPRIMKTSVDLAGTAVFIALLLGGSLAGVAGVLVAVPSAVLVAVLIEEYIIRPAEASGEPDIVPVASPQLR
jgi:predicted PurR-regulated permease PerM